MLIKVSNAIDIIIIYVVISIIINGFLYGLYNFSINSYR